MHVYLYLYPHVCLYVYLYIHIRIYIYMYMHMILSIFTSIYPFIYLLICLRSVYDVAHVPEAGFLSRRHLEPRRRHYCTPRGPQRPGASGGRPPRSLTGSRAAGRVAPWHVLCQVQKG